MQFKKGTSNLLKNIFAFTDDISVFRSRMNFQEFEKDCLEYSGNEAKTICDFYLPCKCKRSFSLGRTDPGSLKDGHLPDSFFLEWDSTTTHFKKLYLGKYLTQEFFESNPHATLKFAENCFKNYSYPSESELFHAWKDLVKVTLKLSEIKHQFNSIEMFLLRLEGMKKENLLSDVGVEN